VGSGSGGSVDCCGDDPSLLVGEVEEGRRKGKARRRDLVVGSEDGF